MGVSKKILIDGREVEFKASAAIPRLYRNMFQRDIYKDLMKLDKDVASKEELDFSSLELFENIAFIMAKHADPKGVANSPDEWLEEFSTFSIYQILPELIELWTLNMKSEVDVKKNYVPPSVR